MLRAVRVVLAASLTLGAGIATAGQETPFTVISDHYEAVRQALLHDTTKGVGGHATAIADQAAALEKSFDAAAAGVVADSQGACEALLPDIVTAARKLATADDLAAARAAFGELSKPLVRYREMVPGERPMVVYCPMAKESWLQPEGEVGNPYFGQSMARCGQIVSK